MLVLTRRVGQSLTIGKDIVVTVEDIIGQKVRLGIKAPRPLPILRDDAIVTTPREAPDETECRYE